MSQTPATKLRIAASVLFATGFWNALAGRFLFADDLQNIAHDDVPPVAGDWVDWRGALHVHTTYSDGASDVPTMMDAAREAGVHFVLLSDHNTLKPLRDGWEARFDGPLLLIGTEITVEGGAFLLALDLPPAWEPTKEIPAQRAIDDVRAHGGLPLVSLPYDVKHPWTDWGATGYDGLEVLNLSTVARAHINIPSILWLLPIWRLRGAMAAMRALVTRPDAPLRRWDKLIVKSDQPIIGIGSLDAHALMKIGRRKYPIPSYTDSFRAATTHVLLPPDVALTSDAAAQRRAIHDALRTGRCYFAYDCLGDPTGLTFTATPADVAENNPQSATMGETLTISNENATTDVRLVAVVGSCLGNQKTLLRLYRDGTPIMSATNGRLEYVAREAGAYRVEVYLFQRRIGALFVGARAWAFTNPIYVRRKNR